MIEQNLIQDYFVRTIRKHWDCPALSDYNGKTWNYQDVAARILQNHILFENLGIKRGDKIALMGRNSSAWAVSFVSIISYGAVVVPILADFSAADAHNIVNHSESKLLFAGDLVWENLDEEEMPELLGVIRMPNFEVVVARVNYLKAYTPEAHQKEFEKKYSKLTAENFALPHCPNEDLCEINYTSGTTGFSKGVMLTYNSISANITYAIQSIPLASKDDLVSILPLAHAYGCAFEFIFPFSIGCHIHFLTRNPSPKVILQAFAEIKPRLILMVPLILEKVYKKQILPKIKSFPLNLLLRIPGLKEVIYKKILTQLMASFGGNFLEVVVGGAAMNAEVEDFLRLIKFPYTTGYGMTECGPLISYSRFFDLPARSCGAPMTFVEVKIDSDDPQKVAGEILVKGENVMLGYYKNPTATAEALDEEGWLHTGDLGVINEKGQIFIKGRCKTMILGASGQNIYPEHIEGIYNNKCYVQESLILEKNHKLVGLIVPDFERADHHKLSRTDLQEIIEQYRKEINKQLGSFEQISQVILFPEEFEKTPKRSIKRYLYKNVSIPS